jgi:hypothetical protein
MLNAQTIKCALETGFALTVYGRFRTTYQNLSRSERFHRNAAQVFLWIPGEPAWQKAFLIF